MFSTHLFEKYAQVKLDSISPNIRGENSKKKNELPPPRKSRQNLAPRPQGHKGFIPFSARYIQKRTKLKGAIPKGISGTISKDVAK